MIRAPAFDCFSNPLHRKTNCGVFFLSIIYILIRQAPKARRGFARPFATQVQRWSPRGAAPGPQSQQRPGDSPTPRGAGSCWARAESRLYNPPAAQVVRGLPHGGAGAWPAGKRLAHDKRHRVDTGLNAGSSSRHRAGAVGGRCGGRIMPRPLGKQLLPFRLATLRLFAAQVGEQGCGLSRIDPPKVAIRYP